MNYETGEIFPAPAYAENVLTEVFEDAKRLLLDAMIDVDIAHTAMLREQGIISDGDAETLFKALSRIDLNRVRSVVYDGTCEDLFFYIESLITGECGEDIAGKMHTARSRNDTAVTMYRLKLRAETLALMRATLDVWHTLLTLAARHHDDLMPAYTHTQPAQPTTLAHYLLAMAEVTGRDVARLVRAYCNLNTSPLGACAITTTGFPVNRFRTSDLLGFDAPTVNAYASIAAVDYFTELLSTVSIQLINTGRFAQEFLLLATREFNALRLSDGYVQTSSIMPQKRNPVALEHIRALSSKAFGEAHAALLMTHNTPFGDINDVEDDLQPLTSHAMRDATRATRLLAATLSTATFNTQHLRRRAKQDFITITELADVLARNEKLPFRIAHTIVARAVTQAEAAHQTNNLREMTTGELLTYKLLQTVAASVIGKPLALTEAQFANALDPENFIRIRDVYGGTSPTETRRAWQVQHAEFTTRDAWYSETTQKLDTHRNTLKQLLHTV